MLFSKAEPVDVHCLTTLSYSLEYEVIAGKTKLIAA